MTRTEMKPRKAVNELIGPKFWTMQRIRNIDPDQRRAVLESFTWAELRAEYGSGGFDTKKDRVKSILSRCELFDSWGWKSTEV